LLHLAETNLGAVRLLETRSVAHGPEHLKMPAVNVGLLAGELSWREHDGGDTDGPNWGYFIPWAGERLSPVH
jgi:hypothetical protein